MWNSRCHQVVWLCLVLVVCCVTGCEDSKQTETTSIESPWSGVKLEVSLPTTPDITNAWRQSADEWQERTLATVDLKTESEAPSLIQGVRIIPIVDVPDLFAAEKLGTVPQDLVDEAGNGLWSDIPRGLRDAVCSRRKQKAGIIPLSCPTLVCYYRADLLHAAKLRPPKTWGDYQQLAENVADWAPGLTVAEPWSEDFRATMFLARAASYARYPGNFSLCFDIYSGKPLMDGKGFVKALEESLAAIATMPKDVLQLSPLKCSQRVRGGQAALAIGYETLAERSTRDNAAVIGFVPLPGRKIVFDRSVGEWKLTPDKTINQPTLTAFTGYCAAFSTNLDENQQRAAINLIATLTGEEEFSSVTLPGDLRSICTFQQGQLAEQWYGQQLKGDEARNYCQAVLDGLSSTELVAELPIMGREMFRTSLTTAISNTLDGNVTAAESLQALNIEWKTLMKKLGSGAVQNSYRASFGLSAR